MVGLFIDGEQLGYLAGSKLCFSALLVGLFIDGGDTFAGMQVRQVSVPSWLGCSLMGTNVDAAESSTPGFSALLVGLFIDGEAGMASIVLR